jgi:hypothetical protein
MSRLTLKADNEERAALDVTHVGDNTNKGGALFSIAFCFCI